MAKITGVGALPDLGIPGYATGSDPSDTWIFLVYRKMSLTFRAVVKGSELLPCLLFDSHR